MAAQPAVNLLDAVQEHRAIILRPRKTRFRTPRLSCVRRRCADWAADQHPGDDKRQALQSLSTGAASTAAADTALSFGSQGADIGNIPASRSTICKMLRDGATAQYGSDAIGGVLNYQMRNDEGIGLQAVYGKTYEGDGATQTASPANAGFENWRERLHQCLAAEWFDEQGDQPRCEPRRARLSWRVPIPAVADSIPNAPGGPAQIWGTSPTGRL